MHSAAERGGGPGHSVNIMSYNIDVGSVLRQ